MKIYKNLIILFAFISTTVFADADFIVEAERTTWFDARSDVDRIQDVLVIGDFYSDKINLQVSLELFSPDQLSELQRIRCIFEKEGHSYLLFRERCLLSESLPEKLFDRILHETVQAIEGLEPSYRVEVPAESFGKLHQNELLKILGRSPEGYQSQPVEHFLSKSIEQSLWRVFRNQANCYGTVISAVTKGLLPRYTNGLPRAFMSHTIEVTNSEWQFGDVIQFKGVGHAMVYVGTDPLHGKMVLTKNGHRVSAIQLMKFDDVYNIYEKYGIGEIARHRVVSLYTPGKKALTLNTLPAPLRDIDPRGDYLDSMGPIIITK